MSTEMESIKVYTDVICADLDRRAGSVERLAATLKTDFGVSIAAPDLRKLSHLLTECVAIADALERALLLEQSGRRNAETAAAQAMALLCELKDCPPQILPAFQARLREKL